MQILVIDSSVIVKWLHREDEQFIDQADLILEEARQNYVELIAPELAKYEVGNALFVKKKLNPEQAEIVLAEFYNLPLSFISESEKQATETFKLAFDLKITYYDASFLSLAKQYGATLVTDNIKHQGKTKEIRIISLKNY